jgi:D-sedoheptulose 7-phosphate isomerase
MKCKEERLRNKVTTQHEIVMKWRNHVRVGDEFLRDNLEKILEVSFTIANAFIKGHKVMIFGNGGSASDASHVAAEFVNGYELKDRIGLPAIALNTDMATLTAIGNDRGYDEVFSKQVEALGQRGDVVIVLTTSGTSKNVIAGLETANELELFTIGVTGYLSGVPTEDGRGNCADCHFVIPSTNTAIVQEINIVLWHTICGLVEDIIFTKKDLPH